MRKEEQKGSQRLKERRQKKKEDSQVGGVEIKKSFEARLQAHQ